MEGRTPYRGGRAEKESHGATGERRRGTRRVSRKPQSQGARFARLQELSELAPDTTLRMAKPVLARRPERPRRTRAVLLTGHSRANPCTLAHDVIAPLYCLYPCSSPLRFGATSVMTERTIYPLLWTPDDA